MGITIRWDITNKCNLYCKHCASNSNYCNSEEELSTIQVFIIIEKLAKSNVSFVKLLGGEPLLRSDIVPIIECLASHNIQVGITTNGTIAFSEQLLKLLKQDRIKYIAFSIDSIHDEINSILRSENTTSKIMDNIKALNEFRKENSLNFKLSIISVLHKYNYDKVTEMITFASLNGIDKISFGNLSPRGRASKLKHLICTSQELLYTSKLIAQGYSEHGMNTKIEPCYAPALIMDYIKLKYGLQFPVTNYYCRACTELGYVNAYGNLFPCESLTERYNFDKRSLLNEEFDDIWNSQMFNEVYQDVETGMQYDCICKNCKYQYKYCYPCLGWSMKTTLCNKMISEYPELIKGDNTP